jgi:hypothetical protein
MYLYIYLREKKVYIFKKVEYMRIKEKERAKAKG